MIINDVGIIDLDISNIGSLINTISTLNFNCLKIKNPEDINKFNKIIIPGVGSYDIAMSNIKNRNWLRHIKNYVQNPSNYLLGICLGMQILSSMGFENNKETKGLDIIKGEVDNLLNKGCKLQLPHIGWNEVNFLENSEPLTSGIPNKSDFYFVHNFGFFAENKVNIIGQTNYDCTFASIVRKKNIFGVQFHPEKSSFQGKRILDNFLKINA